MEFYYWYLYCGPGPYLAVVTANVPNRAATFQISLNRADIGNAVLGTHACGIDRFSGIEDGAPFTDRTPPASQEGAFYHPLVTSATLYAVTTVPESITHAWSVVYLF